MDVLMPQLGETVAEGKITKWFKAAGDDVKPGDNLFEIETDKVSMEVPSTTAGVLAEIRVGAGEVAPVGAVVAVIADKAGAAAPQQSAMARRLAAAHAAASTKPAASSPLVPAQAGTQGRQTEDPQQAALDSPLRGNERTGVIAPLDPFFEVRTPERNYGPARLAGGTTVTPLARRLAAEAGIDLARVKGSGPHG